MIHLIYIVAHCCQFCCDFVRTSAHGLALPPTKQSLIEPAWKSHGSLMETSHLYFYYTTETLLFSPNVGSSPGLIDYRLRQARHKQNCVGLAYWYLYPGVYVSIHLYAKAEFDAVRWLLRLFGCSKHHY